MSPKNKLQEFYQKQGLPLPKYETLRLGGPDHKPVWQSRITTPDKIVIIGGIKPTKSLSESSAAKRALKSIVNDLQPKIILPNRTALLVDVENLPKFINDVCDKYDNLDIYAFVGIHHCLSERKFPSNVIKVLSPSTQQDGTDTCMQVYIGYLLSQNKYDNYLIATRDHFGAALIDMITSDNLLWKSKNAKLVTTIDHIVK